MKYSIVDGKCYMHMGILHTTVYCIIINCRKNKFDVVDFQNATLSGGVAVGAIADLMIQPGGAFIAGSLCGAVSTLGYRIMQVYLVFSRRLLNGNML